MMLEAKRGPILTMFFFLRTGPVTAAATATEASAFFTRRSTMDYSLWDTFPFPAAPEKILFIIAFAINLFHYIQHRHTTVLSANHKAVKVATLGVPAETTGKESITLLMINFVVHQVGK